MLFGTMWNMEFCSKIIQSKEADFPSILFKSWLKCVSNCKGIHIPNRVLNDFASEFHIPNRSILSHPMQYYDIRERS